MPDTDQHKTTDEALLRVWLHGRECARQRLLHDAQAFDTIAQGNTLPAVREAAMEVVRRCREAAEFVRMTQAPTADQLRAIAGEGMT